MNEQKIKNLQNEIKLLNLQHKTEMNSLKQENEQLKQLSIMKNVSNQQNRERVQLLEHDEI